LVRKNFERPAGLVPADLDPITEVAGDGALDYALVIGAFHFINRIADLLHVSLDGLPEPLRRFEFLRRLTVRMASFIMAKMDLDNRPFHTSYEKTLEGLTPLFKQAMGGRPAEEFSPLKSRPKMIEVFQLALEERDIRSSLDRETLSKVHNTVEDALPTGINEAEGFHARPEDPIEAFAFVGTRYAYRSTRDMIDALRKKDFDDVGILDLAVAIAEANQWARIHRLTGLDPDLFYIGLETDVSPMGRNRVRE